MVAAALDQQRAGQAGSSQQLFTEAYRWMLLARILDDKFASLYRGGKITGGCFLGRGQEALSVSAGLSLRKKDVFAPLIRDTAGRLAFGEPILDAVRTYLGSALGPMRGRDGNVHRGRPREGLLAMISHLCAMISVVNGVLFARKLKGISGTVGLASIGDGSTSTGSFHEAMNQAAVEHLPLVVVIANNQFAYSTPNERQFACEDLADKAIGYGVVAHRVDGTSLADCLAVLEKAVGNARDGGGPQLVVGQLLRMCGHGEHDDASYIDSKIKLSPVGRDCLKVAEEQVLSRGWGTAALMESWRTERQQEVDEAVAKVQREPAPDPYAEDWCVLSSRHLSEVFSEPGTTPAVARGVLDLP